MMKGLIISKKILKKGEKSSIILYKDTVRQRRRKEKQGVSQIYQKGLSDHSKRSEPFSALFGPFTDMGILCSEGIHCSGLYYCPFGFDRHC